MRNVTAEEVKQACLDKDITSVDHHKCSLCDVMVRYIVLDGELYFDSSCGCTSLGCPEPKPWEDAANWINMQSKPEIKKELALAFGVECG